MHLFNCQLRNGLESLDLVCLDDGRAPRKQDDITAEWRVRTDSDKDFFTRNILVSNFFSSLLAQVFKTLAILKLAATGHSRTNKTTPPGPTNDHFNTKNKKQSRSNVNQHAISLHVRILNATDSTSTINQRLDAGYPKSPRQRQVDAIISQNVWGLP